MGKTAIIFGITGITGKLLAQSILADAAYDKLISFHRRKSGLEHPKLEEHVVDMFELKKHTEVFKADVVFCCIGTTQSKTSDKEEYKAIDYGIPLAAAELAKENGIPKFIVISALGANPDSRVFYNRVKGEMERDILVLGLPEAYFLEPALLAAERDEKRTAEQLAIKAFKVFNWFLIGPLKKYQSIKPEKLVSTMKTLAVTTYPKPRIESDEIKELAYGDA
ncbi:MULTISPECIES: NAD(P)H-binding protein [unclassified Leeuwenhoekiella]|uniref:NAD(P)H-binding protein n=1 Tax=unclassified Leeuwenhoekiella TaxID=2615029 RepID=UPI000C45BB05|nr:MULTISPECIES: NAD(P)H-binding protein [unclassified Leeuwenhoekiella]MAW95898.1 nucleoside-diphosphate sugar epimerase [Leeuwenhoekiella sp.]MBA82831.1 nucleoside-diphosphate sugar epimerase [Leeuwenhoekiella sp.]